MRIIKIEDLKKILDTGGYRHVSLTDSKGLTIIPFNSNAVPVDKRLMEITRRLDSFACGPGLYNVNFKNNVTKKAHVDTYSIQKDRQDLSEPTVTVVHEEKIVSPDVCSYDEALKMQVENERLKMENAILSKENENLSECVKEFEEEQEGLGEPEPNNVQTWITQILEVGMPILDKHLELKQRELELRAIELSPVPKMVMPKKPSGPEIRSFEKWVMQYDGTPDFNTLKDLYNSAENPEDFTHKLHQVNPGLYEDCLEYMNPNYIRQTDTNGVER